MQRFAWRFNRRHKPVPDSRHCLDVARLLRRITEPVTQSIDRDVKTVVELDESTVWPKAATQLFPAPQTARLLEQAQQNPQRLALKPDLDSGFAEFTCLEIQLESPETQGV
jgi:hypothetical protein